MHTKRAAYHTSLVRLLTPILFALFSLSHLPSWAEDDEEGESFYFEVKPAIIANFKNDRLRFVRADVAIKVRGEDALLVIEENIPLIKHNLIMLFAEQEEESVSTIEGQNALKETALEILTEKFAAEDQPIEIEEVLFTGFLVE